MRTFIAIDLDNEIKNNLSLLISRLKKCSPNIKWIKHQGMHLTLKFLGEIPTDKVSEVESSLRKVTEKHRHFLLKFKGTGTFPEGNKSPRILWLGIEDNENLKIFQSELESELEKIHFLRENRKFHPHLTLGRVKSHHDLSLTLSELEKYREKDFGEMIVKKIILFKSTLKPSGAEYTIISEHELK